MDFNECLWSLDLLFFPPLSIIFMLLDNETLNVSDSSCTTCEAWVSEVQAPTALQETNLRWQNLAPFVDQASGECKFLLGLPQQRKQPKNWISWGHQAYFSDQIICITAIFCLRLNSVILTGLSKILSTSTQKIAGRQPGDISLSFSWKGLRAYYTLGDTSMPFVSHTSRQIFLFSFTLSSSIDLEQCLWFLKATLFSSPCPGFVLISHSLLESDKSGEVWTHLEKCYSRNHYFTHVLQIITK